jgi:hypothetical protein
MSNGTKSVSRVCRNVSISVSPELLRAAKRQAKLQRRNLSNYVQILIERDVNGNCAH